MKFGRGLLGRFIALALGGHDMHQQRAFVVAGGLEYLDQVGQVVAIQGTDVVETQRLEQGTRGQESLQRVFGPFGKLQDILAKGRDVGQKPLHLALQFTDAAGGHLAGDEGRKGADVFGDRHLVVV